MAVSFKKIKWTKALLFFFLTRKERVIEAIALLPLCVFMTCLLIMVAASQVSFECAISPEITQCSHRPTIQHVDEGTEPRRGKAACPVFDSGLCESLIEEVENLLFGGSVTEEGLK